MKNLLKKILVVTASMLVGASGLVCQGGQASATSLQEAIKPIQATSTTGDYKDLMPFKEGLQNKKIIAMGEATHGNKEFFQMKHRMFAFLVKELSIRTFTLEADFGGAQKVNAYIVRGEGTAVEAVKSMGFGMLKVQEMVEMVEWMRTYNLAAKENEKIHFYGFDMQRYDCNKEALLKYMKIVAPDKVANYTKGLSGLTDETGYNQKKEVLKLSLAEITKLLEDMTRNKAAYTKKTSKAAYELAYKHGDIIRQNVTLGLGANNYSNLRDGFMAENIAWILEYEKANGREGIFVSAHNGHIERVSSSMYYGMGNRLSKKYGEDYYAIGTEFYEGYVNARDGENGDRKVFHVIDEGDKDFANQLMQTGVAIGFTDFKTIGKDVEIFNTSQRLHSIGDAYSTLQRMMKSLHTVEQVPSKAYDALVFFKKVTPATPLEGKYPEA